MQQIFSFISEYFFQIFSLTIPCLAGFAATQVWKVSTDPKPSAWRSFVVCAGITSFLSTLIWLNVASSNLLQAVTVGITVGLSWPFAVLSWFVVAKRFAPQAAERLKGNNGEMTILPWVQKKK